MRGYDLPPGDVLDVFERGLWLEEEVISRIGDCCTSGMSADEARRYITDLLHLDEPTVGEYIERYWYDKRRIITRAVIVSTAIDLIYAKIFTKNR